MNKHILFVLVAFTLLIAGCSTSLRDYTDDYAEDYLNGLHLRANDPNKGIFDYEAFGACEIGTCKGFVCKYTESTLCEYSGALGRLGGCGFNSLKGGSCEVIDNFGDKEYQDYNDLTPGKPGANSQIMQFMIGQGASFGDFSEANRYCNNRLTLSTKWLVGDDKSVYKSSDADRAGCFLDKDIMPMYIQYSDGKNIDVDAASLNALTLGKADVGPAIITAEMNFDGSDPAVISKVKQQLLAMKAACPKCLVALAPRMGESEEVLNKFLKDDAAVSKSIDLVAFGIDSRYASVCNGDKIYLADALPFARMINYKFGKPSIIAYIMVDEGGANSLSLNPALRNTCTWDHANTVNAYSSFFSNQIPSFRDAGVIGASLYSFNTVFGNPLNCNNCAIASDDEKRDIWFGWCQAYHHSTTDIKTDANLPSISFGVNPTIFSGGSGGVCSLSTTNLGAYTGVTYKNQDFSQPQNPPAEPPLIKASFTCESCLTQGSDIQSVNGVNSGALDILKMCEQDPPSPNELLDSIIKKYSEARDLDSSLVRAVIWQETTFTDTIGKGGQCAISSVPLSSRGCNLNDINIAGANGLSDPAGICDGAIQAKAAQIHLTNPSTQKFCAYGIMQNIEYPTYLYGTAGNPQIITDSGCLDVDGQYNPFDLDQSVCLGTYKLKDYSDQVRTRITGNPDYQEKLDLIKPDGTVDAYKSNLYTAYLALHLYYGDFNFNLPNPNCPNPNDPNDPNCQDVNYVNIPAIVENFNTLKTLINSCESRPDGFYCSKEVDDGMLYGPVEDKCRDALGEKDFIVYGRKCTINNEQCNIDPLTEDYGSCVLAKYKKMINECANAVCPSDQKLFNEMEALYPTPVIPP